MLKCNSSCFLNVLIDMKPEINSKSIKTKRLIFSKLEDLIVDLHPPYNNGRRILVGPFLSRVCPSSRLGHIAKEKQHP